MEYPGMSEDFYQWQPALRVLDQYWFHQILVFWAKTFFEHNFTFANLLCYLNLVSPEWGLAMAQLIQENSQTPQVKQMVMRLLFHHFGCHILQSSAESISLFTLFIWLLNAPTEVTNFEYIFFTNEKIFGFQITMDEAILVQKVNASHCLDKKVECLVFC